jgi:hypothetical protein
VVTIVFGDRLQESLHNIPSLRLLQKCINLPLTPSPITSLNVRAFLSCTSESPDNVQASGERVDAEPALLPNLRRDEASLAR